MAAKKKSAKEVKARKQKIFIAIGGAVLVLVLIIQAPRILSIVHGGGDEPTAEPYKAFPDAVLNAGKAAPISVSTSGVVVLQDDDPQPEPDTGQLVDFALFPSKDPFVQQVDERVDGEGKAAEEGQPAPKSEGTGDNASGGSGSEGSGAGAGTGGVEIEQAAPSAATISVNGTAEDVQVGGKFPSADPAFVLVSATHSSARIGIAGGSLASGDQTVALRRGHTLTLVNTVDGTEYHLKLVSLK